MTINSIGYSGGVTTLQWTDMSSRLGYRYAVHGAAHCKVTSLSSGTRAVRIAPGTISGGGVTDVSDANVDISLPNVTSGTRWFLVGARRDWTIDTENGTGATVFDYIAGTDQPVIPTRPTNPGGQDFQPLALVRIDAGKTVPVDVRDLRAIVSNSGDIIAHDDLVRSYINEPGSIVVVRGVEWFRALSTAGIASWTRRTPTPAEELSGGFFASEKGGKFSSMGHHAKQMVRDGRHRHMVVEQNAWNSLVLNSGDAGNIGDFTLFSLNDPRDFPVGVVEVVVRYNYGEGGAKAYGWGRLYTGGDFNLVNLTPGVNLRGRGHGASSYDVRVSFSYMAKSS